MKRLLLKISGELLSKDDLSIHPEAVTNLANLVSGIKDQGYEIALVLGGGNIYRWSKLIEAWVDPSDSHNMSMLSTVFNAVSLKNFLEKKGVKTQVMDALHVEFLETYRATKAREYIDDWKVVIACSWGGTPFFTTDTTGVLRALELHCDAIIKITKVDGVYDSDPVTNKDAKKFDTLHYNDVITKDLKVLDQTAVIMARDNALPIYVTRLEKPEDIDEIIIKETLWTKIA